MTFFVNDSFDTDENYYLRDSGINLGHPATETVNEDFHILGEKLLIPSFDGILRRNRLEEMLDKSLCQFGATLISGRSGTGKTALAAQFAQNRDKVAWYTVESPDTDWMVFSRYFVASLDGVLAGNDMTPVNFEDPAQFLTGMFAKIDAEMDAKPILLVLDDLHHIFDAPWFGEFFSILLHSLGENTHLLLTCRSRPPSPLWRLRSKQMLSVIDEKLLAFNLEETAVFFKQAGLPVKFARKAQEESFGRIAKVKQIANRNPAGIFNVKDVVS